MAPDVHIIIEIDLSFLGSLDEPALLGLLLLERVLELVDASCGIDSKTNAFQIRRLDRVLGKVISLCRAPNARESSRLITDRDVARLRTLVQ